MPHVLKFGVYCEAGRPERDVLELADEYRLGLCQHHWQELRETTAFRNRLVPGIERLEWQLDAVGLVIWTIERDIKRHHSDVRDRNAVTDEQREALAAARERRQGYSAALREKRERWAAFLATYKASWNQLADWKNVKSLERREEMYRDPDWGRALDDARRTLEAAANDESLDPREREAARKRYEKCDWSVSPALLAEYGAIVMPHDLARRQLSREYQDRGLHSGIRGEIDPASRPKRGKDGPGIRYNCKAFEPPAPWRKLVVQFPGGLTVADAAAGRSRMLRIERGENPRIVRVYQRITGGASPVEIDYLVKVHRTLRLDDVIMRWALVIDQRQDRTPDGYWKRTAHVTLQHDLPSKHQAGGPPLYCRLRWTVRRAGVEVAEFWSERVHERLILPHWLVDRRILLAETQAAVDRRANDLLEQHGVTVSGRQSTGLAALQDHLREHPDEELQRNLGFLERRVHRARQVQRWSISTITKIYETVAYRLAAIHGAVWIKPLDLATVKRYNTRDLLREDRIPRDSRKVLAACAPGRLKDRLLKAMPASDEAEPPEPDAARGSDVFTSYVALLGARGGCWSRSGSRRSHGRAEVVET